jgi:hypothetical protein
MAYPLLPRECFGEAENTGTTVEIEGRFDSHLSASFSIFNPACAIDRSIMSMQSGYQLAQPPLACDRAK